MRIRRSDGRQPWWRRRKYVLTIVSLLIAAVFGVNYWGNSNGLLLTFDNTENSSSSSSQADWPPLPAHLAVFREPLAVRSKRAGTWHDATIRTKCAVTTTLPDWILDLSTAVETKIYSQFGEDGVAAYILDRLSNVPPTFVEFGVQRGDQCNTRFLREPPRNWTGVLLDGGYDRPEISLHQEMIHPDNIVSLFEKYSVQKQFGYFSEDTDYADYYLWRSVLQAGYRPRLLVGEVNSNFHDTESVTVHAPGRDVRMWGKCNYFGVSPLALRRLWNKHGYLMVYCTKEQINCFGVHQDDVLAVKDRNPAGLLAAQECLWQKPISWARKIHKCDAASENWVVVDPEGQVTDQEVKPAVMEYCERDSARITAKEKERMKKQH